MVVTNQWRGDESVGMSQISGAPKSFLLIISSQDRSDHKRNVFDFARRLFAFGYHCEDLHAP